MPLVIPDGYGLASIKLNRTLAAHPNVCTVGYVIDDTQTADDDASDLAAAWIGAFTAASTLNTYTFQGVHVLRNNGGSMEAGDHVQSTAGTVSADASAPAIAVRVTKRTAFAGVKFRGRMFLPPAYVAEANVNIAGEIDGATLASVQTKATGFLTAANAAGRLLVLLHSDATAPTLISSLVVRSGVGTQRRRQSIFG